MLPLLLSIGMPVVILILAILGLGAFGFIALAFNLFTAIAIGLLILGGVKLLTPGPPVVAALIMGAGLLMLTLGYAFPDLSIGSTLSLAGMGG